MFERSDIHHSDTGLEMTHDLYIAGYYMLFFDLIPDRAASEGNDNDHIRLEN